MIFLLFSIILSILKFSSYLDPFQVVFSKIAGTLVPLALVAVGYQLKFNWELFKRYSKALSLGLLFKLFLAPLFFFTLYGLCFKSRSLSSFVTILESAMAPMITAGVIADEFGFDRDLSSLMIGLGIPLSVLTVYLWKIGLESFF